MTNYHEQNLKINLKQLEVGVLCRDWLICEITCAAREYKKNAKGWEKEKIAILNLKTEYIFYTNR